jgi:hypothetical protein
MNIPAKYRTFFYYVSLSFAVIVTLGGALGLVDGAAVEEGVRIGGLVLAILTPLLALFNIKPDNGADEEYMAPYVEDAYKE